VLRRPLEPGLDPLVGVMDQPWLWLPAPQGPLQGRQGKLGVDPSRELPADAAPGVGIQDRRQVTECRGQPDVGDIRHPDLVKAVDHQVLDPIGVAPEAMLGVRGRDKPAFELAEQGFFSHDPQHPFVIHLPALARQGMGHPSVAIARELKDDLLDGIPQGDRLPSLQR
jgi:hypothetical protein